MGLSDSHSPDKSNGSGTVPCLVLLPVCIGSEQDKTTWVVLRYFWVTIMMVLIVTVYSHYLSISSMRTGTMSAWLSSVYPQDLAYFE